MKDDDVKNYDDDDDVISAYFWNQDYECPKLHSPLNGAKACDLWLEGGKICTLHCNAGYDFANKPPDAYFCGASGGWLPDEKVPDCSGKREHTMQR